MNINNNGDQYILVFDKSFQICDYMSSVLNKQ